MARLLDVPGVRAMVRRTTDGEDAEAVEAVGEVVDEEVDEAVEEEVDDFAGGGDPGASWTVRDTTIPVSSTFPQLVTVTWAEIFEVGGIRAEGATPARELGSGQFSPTALPTGPTAGGDRPTAEISS